MRKAQKCVKHAEKIAKSDPTWPQDQKSFFPGRIREPLSLFRKECKTHCYLLKPIQVSPIRFKPLAKAGSARVRGTEPPRICAAVAAAAGAL